jgi:ribosomal protein L37AE/L43A
MADNADNTEPTERCPQCKSTQIKHHSDGPYAGYWVCLHQGCSAKLAADPYFWRGAGVSPATKQMSPETAQDSALDER